jgi:hypothetical protein
VFYYIELPSSDQLEQIVQAHFPDAPPRLAAAAVKRFIDLRVAMEDANKGKAGKKVSTSEMLDWFRVLNWYPEDEALGKLEGKLPFAEVLLKRWEDHMRYLRLASETS